MKNLWLLLCIVSATLGTVSCKKDKDEDDGDGSGTTSTVEFVEFTPPRYDWAGGKGVFVSDFAGTQVVADKFTTTNRGEKWSHYAIQNYTVSSISSDERAILTSYDKWFIYWENGWGELSNPTGYTTYHVDDVGNIYWHTPVIGGSAVEFNVAKGGSDSFSKISGVPDNLGHNVLGTLPSNQLLIINPAESIFHTYDPEAGTFTEHAYSSVTNMQLDLLSIGMDGKVYMVGLGFIEVHEVGVGSEVLNLPDSMSSSYAHTVKATPSGELFVGVGDTYLRKNGTGWTHFTPAAPYQASTIEQLEVAGNDVYYYINTHIGEFANGYVRDDLNGDVLMNVPIIAPRSADLAFQTAAGNIYSIETSTNILYSYAAETYTATQYKDVYDICQTGDGSIWLLTSSSVIRVEEDLTQISELTDIGASEEIFVQQLNDGSFMLATTRSVTNNDFSTSYETSVYTSTDGNNWTKENVGLPDAWFRAIGTDGSLYVQERDGGYYWCSYSSDLGKTWQDFPTTNGPNLITSSGKLLWLDAVGVDGYNVNTWNGSAWEAEKMNIDYVDGAYHYVLNGADQIVIQTGTRNVVSVDQY